MTNQGPRYYLALCYKQSWDIVTMLETRGGFQ